jgi:hypothetical protein
VFINKETGRRAFLRSQDGDVTYSATPDGKAHTAPPHVFFADHREATRDEIEEHEAEAAEKRKDARKSGAGAPPARPDAT